MQAQKMFHVDVYQYHYHFRYSSSEEQNTIKQMTHRSKLAQFIEPKMFPFSVVQCTMSGLVQYLHLKALPTDSERELNQRGLSLLPLPPAICNDKDCNLEETETLWSTTTEDDHLSVQEFVFCHLYEEMGDSVNVFTELNDIIPQFIVSKKPELNVTCSLHKLRHFSQVSQSQIQILRNVQRYMLLSMKIEEPLLENEASIALIPLIGQKSHSKENDNRTLHEFLHLELLEAYFTKHELNQQNNDKKSMLYVLNSIMNEDVSLLKRLNKIQSIPYLSLTQITSTFANYVPQLDNITDLERLIASSDEFKEAIEQANIYSHLVRDQSVVRRADNSPFVAESLEFFELECDDHGIYHISCLKSPTLKVNGIDNPALYKSKKWFLENRGPVTSRLYTLSYTVGAQHIEKKNEAREEYDETLQKLLASSVISDKNLMLYQCYYVPFDFASFGSYMKNVVPSARITTEQLIHYNRLVLFEKELGTDFLTLSKQKGCSHVPLLLRNAFTHMSYAQEKQLRSHSYERLEFLGDSTLHICAATYIFKKFHVTSTTQAKLDSDWYDLFTFVIGNKQLCQRAIEMNLDQYILAPRGPSKALPIKMSADVFESILGAIQITHGFNRVRDIVENQYIISCIDNSGISVSPFCANEADTQLMHSLLENMEDKIIQLEQLLGYTFQDKSLLIEALIDPSYNDSMIQYTSESMSQLKKVMKIRKNSIKWETGQSVMVGDMSRLNHESLKFLGVALLKYLSVQHIFQRFPQCDPRQMTLSVHALLDYSDVCFQSALKQLRLEEFVLLQQLDYLQAAQSDTMVALFAAIYVDSGYSISNEGEGDVSTVQKLFNRLMLDVFDKEDQLHPDHIKSPLKQYLQHLCQLVYKAVPHFETTEIPKRESEQTINTNDHNYKCTISCQEVILIEHTGSNRKIVERNACEQAIKLVLERL